MVQPAARHQQHTSKHLLRTFARGFTLIEVLVVIVLISVTLFSIQSLILSLTLSVRQRHLAQAGALVEAEIETLLSEPFSSLTNRANAPFQGILANIGLWSVEDDASAPGAPHIYQVMSRGTSGSTGISRMPVGTVGDFTLTASAMAQSTSPAGWRAGLLVRAHDDQNSYRVSFSASDIRIEKISSGIVTTLWTQAQIFSAGTWNILQISCTGTSIALMLNGSLLTTVTDATYPNGVLALWAGNGAHVSFDDITVNTPELGSESWQFDTDEVSANPQVWQRFGINDLPQGVATLTIEDYAGSSDIKKITAVINWQERGPRSSTLTTLINKY